MRDQEIIVAPQGSLAGFAKSGKYSNFNAIREAGVAAMPHIGNNAPTAWHPRAEHTIFDKMPLPNAGTSREFLKRMAMSNKPNLSNLSRTGRLAAAALFSVLCCAGLGSAAATAESPFTTLAGSWTGTGTVTYASAAKERLRCSVDYNENNDKTSEDSLIQRLTCTSPSYDFKINAYYRNQDGSLSGHWDELVLKISGSISGTVSPSGRINGSLRGPAFMADVLVDTRGDRQTVKITAQNQEIREVSVDVRRK